MRGLGARIIGLGSEGREEDRRPVIFLLSHLFNYEVQNVNNRSEP